MSAFHKFLVALGLAMPRKENAPAATNKVTSDTTTDVCATESSDAVMPFDEHLLDRARTQWQFGDWEGLAHLNRDTLQHHPDRAKLALLSAAARLQMGENAEAKKFIGLAQDWGVSEKLISQILISGVHNSIGRAAFIGNYQSRALKHFEKSVDLGSPNILNRLLTAARKGFQLQQIGLSTTESMPASHLMESIEFRSPKKRKYKKNSDYSHYRKELEEIYKIKTGRVLDLDNPVTYNEKIQWLKIYDSTSIKSRLADKYQVRKWVEKKIGDRYLIPLLGVWDNFKSIDFSILPEKFVLKANHGYGWNIIVKNKEQLNIIEAENKFNRWLSTNFAFVAGFEMHYANIKPKIIAEEYIAQIEGNLYDYKVYCFNGKAEFIGVFIDRQSELALALYDTSWKRHPVRLNGKFYEHEIEKPECLDELIYLAETLSVGFVHVRVDFYILTTGIKFGEMTFTPASGWRKFDPEEYDLIFGNLIDLT